MFGMLRTTWSWPRIPVRAAVVAPARTLRTSWPRRRCGPISRPTLASIWGLIPNRMTSAPLTASTLDCDGPDAVLAGEVVAALRPRVAGDDLARLHELAAQDARDHGLGHHAGADRRDRGLRQGGHRAEYSRGVRGDLRARRARWPTGRSGDAGQEESPGARDHGRFEPCALERGLEIGRLVVDLDDREFAAVIETADGGSRRPASDGRRRSIADRIESR